MKKRKYCSKECVPRAASEDRTCNSCGEVFTAKAIPSDIRRFCSKNCADSSRKLTEDERARRAKESKKKKIHTIECEYCGNLFNTEKVSRRYCSRSCAGKGKYVNNPNLREVSRDNMYRLRETHADEIREYLLSDRNPIRMMTSSERSEISKRTWERVTSTESWTTTTEWQKELFDALTAELPGCRLNMEQRIYMKDGESPRFYIADIVIEDTKMIVEVDGWVHHQRKEYDARRTMRLDSIGWSVMRFWNSEIQKDLGRCIRMVVSRAAGQKKSTP